MWSNEPNQAEDDFLDRIQDAFEWLLGRGVLHCTYMCCGRCSIAELEGAADKDPRMTGGVYYHEQDLEGLREDRSEGIYLGFVGFSIETAVVGKMLTEALHGAGVKTKWDGRDTTRIFACFSKVGHRWS